MNFVPEVFNLPVFLATRIPMRTRNQRMMWIKYMQRRRRLYSRDCNKENAPESATIKYFQHICGLEEPKRCRCLPQRLLKSSRSLTKIKNFHLPPNIYNTSKEPYESKRGSGGAHWAKLDPNKRRVGLKRECFNWHFYDLPRDTSRWTESCHMHKGAFVTNARERRPTARIMLNDLTLCYRDPKEPGATHYNPQHYTIQYNSRPKTKVSRLNPHIFYRHSCVPLKPNSIHKPHISFQPAPGRYETRFKNICYCMRNMTYAPGLQLMIDREKRLKFRRLPYKKISTRRACSPDWRHVTGHGHTWLFRLKKKIIDQKMDKETKKNEKTLQLYPDAKYIHMITQPNRVNLSFRDEPMPSLPVRVKYNCIAKRIIRKQLRSNKKIAFMSGQERFKDLDKAPILTVRQMEEIKSRLPLERQLRDHPVMTRSLSEIQPRLEECPPRHRKPTYELELRKRLYKFLPLPEAKVLVTEEDTRTVTADGRYKPEGYFLKHINDSDFFKDETIDTARESIQS